MPYVKNWLHCVWSAKNRKPFLTSTKKPEIISHIRTYAGIKGIYIDLIDGHSEHLHCLLLLHCDQTLSFVMQMIKGESSYWINKNKLTKEKFEWADEYYCTSVSEYELVSVREYIKNQDFHHRSRSWEEECEEFLEHCSFSRVKV